MCRSAPRKKPRKKRRPKQQPPAPAPRFLLLFWLLGLKVERSRVHAIAHAGGPWPIGKNVPQMRVAFGTARFRPLHAIAAVGMLRDGRGIDGLEETGPASAGIKLGF